MWLVFGLASIFILLSFINNTLYPFPSPFAYVLFVIQTPALIAGALATGRDSINWVVFSVTLFCTYIIIFGNIIILPWVVYKTFLRMGGRKLKKNCMF